jgi:hypothetical protein
MFFSGEASWRNLVLYAKPPGRRLLPATGAPTPQMALTSAFQAGPSRGAEAQCAYEATSYIFSAADFGLWFGLFNTNPQLKKRLETLPPATKKPVDNFFVTGKGTDLFSLVGALPKGYQPPPGRYKDITVRLTKVSPTQATMDLRALGAGSETFSGRTRTI